MQLLYIYPQGIATGKQWLRLLSLLASGGIA